MAVKIFAFGPIFFMDNFNIIDLTIVTLSWIELSTLWHAHDTGSLEDANSASSASARVISQFATANARLQAWAHAVTQCLQSRMGRLLV